MSTSSDVALGPLRFQAQQRGDLENNASVSNAEWNAYITNSRKRLYNMLVAAYGNDYFVSNYYQFTLGNSQLVPLPNGGPGFVDETGAIAPKMYKLLDVDLQYSASPSGWITLRRFEEIERNKYANNTNVALNWNGYTNLRYRLSGNNIEFVPFPVSSQQARIKYIPAPTNLQYLSVGYTTGASSVIGSISDTTGITVGMNAYGFTQGVIPNSNVFVNSVSTTTVTLSTNALATVPQVTLAFWNDAQTVDGIAGWEEFIILDAAIKAQIKQEGPSAELMSERQILIAEIESMAEARDAGQAFHVSVVLGANGYSYDGSDFGGGYGMGGDW